MIAYRLNAAIRDAKALAVANVETRGAMLQRYPNAAESYLDQWPVDWRAVARSNAKRRYHNAPPWNPAYADEFGATWRHLESANGSGLVVACDNATASVSPGTTAYYVDSRLLDTQHGVVLATRSKGRYFAAITDPHTAGAYRVLWSPFDNLRDAMHRADSEAQRDAAAMREHCRAWCAGREWSDIGEEIKGYRAQALAILRDRKAASGSATLCGVIREKIELLRQSIADGRHTRTQLRHGAFEGVMFDANSAALRLAFCEGAGVATYPA